MAFRPFLSRSNLPRQWTRGFDPTTSKLGGLGSRQSTSITSLSLLNRPVVDDSNDMDLDEPTKGLSDIATEVPASFIQMSYFDGVPYCMLAELGSSTRRISHEDFHDRGVNWKKADGRSLTLHNLLARLGACFRINILRRAM